MNGYEVLTSYMWPWDFSHPGQNPRKSNPEDDQQKIYWNIFKLIHPYAGPTSYMWPWVFHLPALNHGNLNSRADQQGNLVEYLRLHTRFYRAYVTLVALPIRRKSNSRAYQQGNMLEQFQFQIVFKGLASYMWPWVFEILRLTSKKYARILQIHTHLHLAQCTKNKSTTCNPGQRIHFRPSASSSSRMLQIKPTATNPGSGCAQFKTDCVRFRTSASH